MDQQRIGSTRFFDFFVSPLEEDAFVRAYLAGQRFKRLMGAGPWFRWNAFTVQRMLEEVLVGSHVAIGQLPMHTVMWQAGAEIGEEVD